MTTADLLRGLRDRVGPLWDLREDALLAAAKVVGLEWRVAVTLKRISSPFEGEMVVASYDPDSPEDMHIIWLNVDAPFDVIDESIWHELGHALQRERGEAPLRAQDFDDIDSYNDDPREVEAQSWEDVAEAYPRIAHRGRCRGYWVA